MPRISLDLNRDEFSRLSDRAFSELRHPRDEARIIVREALGFERTLTPPGEAEAAKCVPTGVKLREEVPDGRV